MPLYREGRCPRAGSPRPSCCPRPPHPRPAAAALLTSEHAASRGAQNDERTNGIDPAQETKLRLGVALFPDRLLDTPSRESNTKG